MANWRLRQVHREAALAVIAIEATETWPGRQADAFQVYAKLETVAVIVATPRQVRAWDVTGEAFDLERARARLPDLDSFTRLTH